VLAVDRQGIIPRAQQPCHRRGAQPVTLSRQLLRDCPPGVVRPLQPGDWIARRGITHHFLECPAQGGIFFSCDWRPPPTARRRPAEPSSTSAISRPPRGIVVRLKPVTRARCWTPPEPWRVASNPTKRRRLFSSRVASTRLMLVCNSAASPVGSCGHS